MSQTAQVRPAMPAVPAAHLLQQYHHATAQQCNVLPCPRLPLFSPLGPTEDPQFFTWLPDVFLLSSEETAPRILCQTGMIDHQADDGPWLDWCAPAVPAVAAPCCGLQSLSLLAAPHAIPPQSLVLHPSHLRRAAARPTACCRAQSEDECPHYTNLSLELLSHARLARLHNPCGDPTPEEGPYDSPEPESPAQGDSPPDDVSSPLQGPGQQPPGAPPMPTNDRRIKPFTPGRQ